MPNASQSRAEHPSNSARLTAAVTALVFFACVIGDLIVSDHRRGFGYLASDSYYYLTIARHVVHEGRFAFDGIHATNGFHPLWQVLLVPLAAVADGHALVVLVVVVGAIAIAAAIYLLGLALARDGKLTPLYGIVLVGGYGLLAAPAWWRTAGADPKWASPMCGTLFSFVNGMESPPLLLLFAAVVYLYATSDVLATRTRAIVFGASWGALVLARLDHVLLALPVLVWLSWHHRRQWRLMFFVLLAFGLTLSFYLVPNRLWFGSFMPVSGSIKSSFPYVNHFNLARVWACVTHFKQQTYWRLYRVEQIVIPMLVALVYLVGAAIVRPRGRVAQLLIPLGAGVLLLGAYDLLYVELMLQGHWYQPVSVLYVSLVLFVMVGSIRRPTIVFALALCVSLAGFFKLHRYVTAGQEFASFFYDVAPKVREHYAGRVPHLLENDDGIISFSTGFPAMAGMGLALDPEAAQAWMHANIVPLAVSRGFDHMTSWLYWRDAYELKPNSDSNTVREFIEKHLFIPHSGTFDYRVDYLEGSFLIVGISPVGEREP